MCYVENKVNETIIVGGAYRSGTTILGKLISSFQDIELFYEPPFLQSFHFMINKMDTSIWKQLFIRYLYEELLIESLSGRRLNLNKGDDSNSYNYLTKKEIEKRTKQTIDRQTAGKKATNKRILIKESSIILHADLIKKIFPDITFLVLYRNANEVINSLLKKKWFHKDTLTDDSAPMIMPHQVYKGMKYPFWLSVNDFEFWEKAEEADRCALYYLTHYEKIKNNPSLYTIISYNRLVNDPTKVSQELSDFLNASPTSITSSINSQIEEQTKKNPDRISNLSNSIKNRVLNIQNDLETDISI